jgi:hypothetical protein
MGEIYRVVVTRELTDAEGETQYETLFEVAGVNRERLGMYASTEVAAALGADVADPRGAGYRGDAVPTEAASVPDARPERPTEGDELARQRRTRRTKAQIAADDAAAKTAADAAPVQQQAPAEVPAAETASAPAGVVTTTTFAGAQPVPAVAAPPAAPYNPFAPKG